MKILLSYSNRFFMFCYGANPKSDLAYSYLTGGLDPGGDLKTNIKYHSDVHKSHTSCNIREGTLEVCLS